MQPETPPLRIFIVSALPAVRAGLQALIGAADDCRVVGCTDRPGPDSWRAVVPAPDVVVIDAAPDLDPAEPLGPEPSDSGPALVILGPIAAELRLPSDLYGRAWSYLPRDASGEQVVAAVRAVGRGLVAIDPTMGERLLARRYPGDVTSGEESGDDLTARELEVLQLIALGLPNKLIASRLTISEHTVKFHVAAILSKLGAGSRTEAVHLGARRGLVAL